ncbi:MAG: serine hydrolase domain-containing protein [Candidatus Methylumidiphilus sp.]
MTPKRRTTAKLAAGALCALLAAGLHFGWNLAATGVAYKAKALCSGVFVSGRSPQSVLAGDLEVEDLAPLRAIATQVDAENRQVSASFFGLIRRQAVYQPGFGCTLAFGASSKPRSYSPLSAAQAMPPKIDGPALPLARIGPPPRHIPQPAQPRLSAPPNPARLQAALDWAFAEPDPQHRRRTRAVVVMRDGAVIAERYAPGFGPDRPLPGWSMAKSVMNALVGILVGQGRLDLNAPAPVPEWQAHGDPRRMITLDQMMHMVSGLEFSESAGEPLGDVTQMLLRAPDAAAYAAAKPLAAPPGTRWHYASGTTNIISRILRDTLGEADYRDFPRRALFAPLGMDSAVLETDAAGDFVGSSFMYATARDWAKLGQLYLQDGMWQGRRLLPAGWVGYSTIPTPLAPGQQYGAHFWLNIQHDYPNDPGRPLPPDAFHAMGHEGQCVSIIPSLGLVVVRLGLTRTASAWRQDRFLNQIIDALAD